MDFPLKFNCLNDSQIARVHDFWNQDSNRQCVCTVNTMILYISLSPLYSYGIIPCHQLNLEKSHCIYYKKAALNY